MKLVEGQLIHRRYRLDSRLAQGGMGEVWKGYDIQLGRPVAIKALRGDLGVTQEAKLLRLRAEAHNSANLAHPNIAALFEYYEHDGIGFLIMEYVPSKSLADLYHEQNGPMDPIKLLPILIQTARGLFVAHSHGVIHRDVKPANIMVSDSGEVKITDFGVSYSTNQEQITQDGMVVGTAQYISPEQAQFLETRKFQINEIARIFRVPPHMVGDLEKSSFSNIEQQSLEFVKYTLEPWLMRWEQSMARRLFSDSEKREYFIRFNVEGLLRGDYASRMNGYAVARQNGWMSANDIRELENLDRIPAEEGGDLYLVNGSMTKLSDAGAFAGTTATNPTETEEQTSE